VSILRFRDHSFLPVTQTQEPNFLNYPFFFSREWSPLCRFSDLFPFSRSSVPSPYCCFGDFETRDGVFRSSLFLNRRPYPFSPHGSKEDFAGLYRLSLMLVRSPVSFPFFFRSVHRARRTLVGQVFSDFPSCPSYAWFHGIFYAPLQSAGCP